LRPILVAVAAFTLAAAAIMAVRTPARLDDELPALSRKALRGVVIRPAADADVRVTRDVAVGVIRRSVFLDEGPEHDPETFPVLATGRIARAPIQASPTGQVVVPLIEDAPAWLVVWHGLRGDTLERFGDWLPEELVDAVFLVDGATGDCCWATRFLAGDARLDQRKG
jgi:hypothetical protein